MKVYITGRGDLIVGALYDKDELNNGPFRYVGYDEELMHHIFTSSTDRYDLNSQVQRVAKKFSIPPEKVWRVGSNIREYHFVSQPYSHDQEPEDDCL